ncbi:putative immune-responsive protein [Stipitochalara longipes BDJ]|nr:putative immune-responsive protein [Stipitochalara longipes BDJ]
MISSASPQSMDPSGPTGKFCQWIGSISLSDIPEAIKTRAKYLILDGLTCVLVGAHLPWSEKATNAILSIEAPGISDVFGWERKISPMSAALLNSTFTQGFELDDWHSEAPLHSNSIILPALFAAASTSDSKTAGSAFLLAYLIGLEVGPRVGKALYGADILTQGWHSGAVFGPSASAAAVSKLFSLNAAQIEDALGIACTQACGLMSAQFESEVKRMQHGFAARNGLLAAILAKGGYVGIKKVYEREYGGFLDMFSKGNGKDPQYLIGELTEGLGEKWQTQNVKIKPYSAMAATHGTIDCVRKLQAEHPAQMKQYGDVEKIVLEMGEVEFHHGGFEVQRPLTSTGAQMSAKYVAATQMVDGKVLPPSFRFDMLDRDELWALVDRTTCLLNSGLAKWSQKVTVTFKNGTTLSSEVAAPRGVKPDLTNEEIVEKWKDLTKGVIDDARRDRIERLCLGLEDLEDVMELSEVLAVATRNPIA